MGTPKSSILIGFSIINHPFLGTPNFWKHPLQRWVFWRRFFLKTNPRQEDTLPKEFSRLGEFSQQSLPCRWVAVAAPMGDGVDAAIFWVQKFEEKPAGNNGRFQLPTHLNW